LLALLGEGAKDLSVNNVDDQRHLPERDDRRGEVVQGEEAALELLVAHEELAEAIEPAMADLDDPATRLLAGLAPLGCCFLAAIDDVRDVAVRVDDAQRLGASVAGVGAQVLAATKGSSLALDHNGAEHLVDSLAVIDVGRGHDDRQRDATPVHQQVPLAPIFFPDPSGWARRFVAPSVP